MGLTKVGGLDGGGGGGRERCCKDMCKEGWVCCDMCKEGGGCAVTCVRREVGVL